MNIPPAAQSILESDQAVNGFVNTAISNAEKWLNDAPLAFFPEYTQHDNLHNEDVFATAIELATLDALKILTPADIGVLIGATLLHDSAMHLSEDGFQTLVDLNSDWKPIVEFDTKTWSELWEDFLSEAKRYDQYKLRNIFGDATPITGPPPENNVDWSKRDRMLIGEFLRLHHPRLAHEMARYGVPGVSGDILRIFPPSMPSHIADLAGLVARSHGMDLRSTFDYLERNFELRIFKDVHAVFLMSLLRIADYLQIQPERAPERVLLLKKLSSPISQLEWRVHACVENITRTHPDPEAIKFDVRPKDAETFVRVQQWLQGIQSELDSSWAVLGEVYGRYEKEGLDKLGLEVRRVRSNIDDVETFQKSIDYIPKITRFESAGTDLLKLLIDPLYGDEKLIGIRELMQNAVDAVRELEHIHRKGIGSQQSLSDADDCPVKVSILYDTEGDPEFIEVKDTGIGMNASILTEYFLTAGASFRRSEFWRSTFENEQHKSEIARAGRFGIGALAAFLLGDQISVKTRRFDETEENGLIFKAGLEDHIINVRRARLPIGTSIKVRLNGVTKKLLGGYRVERELDWYWLPHPRIEYSVEDKISYSRQGRLPEIGDADIQGWASFNSQGLDQAHWKYVSDSHHARSARGGHSFYCNGIPLPDQSMTFTHYDDGHESHIHIGNIAPPDIVISAIDNSGILPIDLARTRLSEHAQVIADVAKAISIDSIVGLITSDDNLLDNSNYNFNNFHFRGQPFSQLDHPQAKGCSYVFFADGMLPYDHGILISQEISRTISIPQDLDLLSALLKELSLSGLKNVGVVVANMHENAPSRLIQSLSGAYGRSGKFNSNDGLGFAVQTDTSFVHEKALAAVSKLNSKSNYIAAEIEARVGQGWFEIKRFRRTPSQLSDLVLNQLSDFTPRDGSEAFVSIEDVVDYHNLEPSLLSQSWNEMISTKIPYDSKSRAEICDKFPNELRKHHLLRKMPKG